MAKKTAEEILKEIENILLTTRFENTENAFDTLKNLVVEQKIYYSKINEKTLLDLEEEINRYKAKLFKQLNIVINKIDLMYKRKNKALDDDFKLLKSNIASSFVYEEYFARELLAEKATETQIKHANTIMQKAEQQKVYFQSILKSIQNRESLKLKKKRSHISKEIETTVLKQIADNTPYRKIATDLKISLGAVQSILRRSKKK